MIINPSQMNMKIWWNLCYDSLMVSIHKRNRMLGEAKIKFEVRILRLAIRIPAIFIFKLFKPQENNRGHVEKTRKPRGTAFSNVHFEIETQQSNRAKAIWFYAKIFYRRTGRMVRKSQRCKPNAFEQGKPVSNAM
jgi:hypothetical protein